MPYWDENGEPVAGEIRTGIVTADETWDAAGGPYIIAGNVSIDSGITLTIEDGAEVRGAGNYTISVEETYCGQCVVHEQQDESGKDWGGIVFNDTSDDATCSLSNCIIEYAATGIRTNNASPAITGCTIQNNRDYGIYISGASAAPVVSGNTVKANGTGIYIDGNAVPVINGGNVIESNTGHGIYSAYSSPTINGNTIRSNTYDGIYLDHVSGKGPKAYAVTGNEITGNRRG